MSEKNPVVESINAMLATLSQAQVEGLNLPQKEVLPAEFKEQLDAVKSELVAEQAKVATLTQEKAELQKVIDAALAEKANAERIAKVTAKAGESLKDNRFAKPIAKQIEALAKTDASFDESKVAAFVAAKVAEYEEAVGGVVAKHGNLTTDDLGSNIGDPEIDELEEQLEIGNETNVFEAVEPAAELNFGRKPKVAAAK